MNKFKLEEKLIEAKAEIIALKKENEWLKSVIEKFADKTDTHYRQWPYFWYTTPTPQVGDISWESGTGDTFTITNAGPDTEVVQIDMSVFNEQTKDQPIHIFSNYSLS